MLPSTVTLANKSLAAFVTPWFLLLTALVGLNQSACLSFGACPSSLLLIRAFRFRKGCAR